MIKIAGLRTLSDRLARLDMIETEQVALANAGQMLQEAIQDTLSSTSGSDHAVPWRQTGTLQSSIGYHSDATGAVVGSDDPAAVDQELGTSNIPPRPFLSPTAAAHAQGIAQQVAQSIATVLRDATTDAAS